MTDQEREENQKPAQETRLEDLQPEEDETESVKGGQRGSATWIFSG